MATAFAAVDAVVADTAARTDQSPSTSGGVGAFSTALLSKTVAALLSAAGGGDTPGGSDDADGAFNRHYTQLADVLDAVERRSQALVSRSQTAEYEAQAARDRSRRGEEQAARARVESTAYRERERALTADVGRLKSSLESAKMQARAEALKRRPLRRSFPVPCSGGGKLTPAGPHPPNKHRQPSRRSGCRRC
jgi:hypothetical protein